MVPYEFSDLNVIKYNKNLTIPLFFGRIKVGVPNLIYLLLKATLFGKDSPLHY